MGFKSFDRTVSFAPGSQDTRFIEAELAKFARQQLREAQAASEAPPRYLRAVNGRQNVPEESVVAPGAIIYSMDWMREAALRSLELLRLVAPKRTGRFSRSFILISDGREVTVDRIGLGQTTLIVNTQPYARKIQVGSKGFQSYRGLFDQARRKVQSEFRGLVYVQVRFVALSDGYRLKTTRQHRGRRKDMRAGVEVNYPALQLTSETIVRN